MQNEPFREKIEGPRVDALCYKLQTLRVYRLILKEKV